MRTSIKRTIIYKGIVEVEEEDEVYDKNFSETFSSYISAFLNFPRVDCPLNLTYVYT